VYACNLPSGNVWCESKTIKNPFFKKNKNQILHFSYLCVNVSFIIKKN
jgi:hypothetical protein